MSRIAGVLFLVVWIAVGCGDKLYNDLPGAPVDAGGNADGGEGPVTYDEHIKPILDAHCISCHSSTLTGGDRNGAPAAFNFDTFTASVAGYEEGNEQIQAGYMPPGTPLSGVDRALFQQWIDDGLQESACSCAVDEGESEGNGGEDE